MPSSAIIICGEVGVFAVLVHACASDRRRDTTAASVRGCAEMPGAGCGAAHPMPAIIHRHLHGTLRDAVRDAPQAHARCQLRRPRLRMRLRLLLLPACVVHDGSVGDGTEPRLRRGVCSRARACGGASGDQWRQGSRMRACASFRRSPGADRGRSPRGGAPACDAPTALATGRTPPAAARETGPRVQHQVRHAGREASFERAGNAACGPSYCRRRSRVRRRCRAGARRGCRRAHLLLSFFGLSAAACCAGAGAFASPADADAAPAASAASGSAAAPAAAAAVVVQAGAAGADERAGGSSSSAAAAMDGSSILGLSVRVHSLLLSAAARACDLAGSEGRCPRRLPRVLSSSSSAA